MPFETASAQEITALVQRAAAGNDAFMNGDLDRWHALLPPASDFSIMTPLGGWSANGFDASPERLAAMAGYFTAAKTDLEVIATHASPDMVVLAVVERQHGVVGGLAPQDWSLRVTLVVQRNGADWNLVHRHADPLVASITLDALSVLAKNTGEANAKQA